MKRGLVLGGGGMVGVAWEVGVLQGLAEAGIDLTNEHQPDSVLGTSAGSIVGALMMTRSLDQLAEMSLDDSTAAVSAETVPLLDLAAMVECWELWRKLPDTKPATLATVGAYALKTNTVTEERWVGSMTDVVGTAWPSDRFRCTAVNAENGDFAIWGHDSNVALDRALASSCAVPCIFPPVTIHGFRYTDGGVRSGTSLDLMAGHDTVFVLAPIGSWVGESLDAAAAIAIRSETAVVEAAGGKVVTLFTDDATNQATLLTPLGRMDPANRQPALDHGRRQGRELADALRPVWLA
jgi:NTE family protein